MNGSGTVIRIGATTYQRLQAHGEGFRGDPLGTPEKVIIMLLDFYEDEHLAPGAEPEDDLPGMHPAAPGHVDSVPGRVYGAEGTLEEGR